MVRVFPLHHRRRTGGERGQILVMFALGLTVFLGFAALTIDIGFLLVTQRSYQNAADASALAGAAYLTRPTGDPCADVAGGGTKPDCAREAAWRYLTADLDLALDDAAIAALSDESTLEPGEPVATNLGSDKYTLWVSTPPRDAKTSSSMSTVRDSNQVVFVRVDRKRPIFLARVLGLSDFNVSAWATAGIFPNRFAVITLRRGSEATGEIDPGPANTTDIKLAGTNSELRVVNGDVGGNWGMKLNAGARLTVSSTTGDEANVLLKDYVSCGNSCWTFGQIVNDNTGAPMNPKKLPSYVADPNYAPPPAPLGIWPNGPVINSADQDIPNGDTDTPPGGGPAPSIVINAGSVTGTGECIGPSGDASDAPRLGPGTYNSLRVRNNRCVILDPLRRFADPELGLDGATSAGDVDAGDPWEWIGASQFPGVYYFTDAINIDNSGLVVGDGVTVIMRPDSAFSPNSGGVMNLNTGKANGGTALKLGAWTTMVQSPYKPDPISGLWNYDETLESDARLNGVGLALYVLKPPQAGLSDPDGTDVIAVNSGAGLSWKGVTYAPNDNVQIAGQPNHDGIGQLVSWTFTFNGGTVVTQTFDGPGDGFPYLIEPCVLVSGSCQ